MSELNDMEFPKLNDDENLAINLLIKYEAIDNVVSAFSDEMNSSSDSKPANKFDVTIPDGIITDFEYAFPGVSFEEVLSSALNKILKAYLDKAS